MSRVQTVLDRYADGTPYERLAAAFLDLERWTGDDPVLLLAEAAASTTGQHYFTGVKPTVERFRETFVDSGRVTTFSELAALQLEDDALVETVGAERKRHVLLEGARVFADRPAGDDLEALQSWASEADYYRYEEDPIGGISGVGPATFQYLRMLAGVDTAKPDPAVTSFVETIGDEIDSPYLDASDPRRAVASCEWLAIVSSYRTIEIDQLAWWTSADADEREAALASQ
ncbi:hypothetical protein OB955_20860 [Halobacteria archaeon AArc-m2/3/4]|uniref:Uncharacterized protein n=1 Tax=Natronoglomus mannanivorans TaxID=2979990 RepID=A0AAP2YZA2_9EURY|nr:hypothetical protein [Halobacteria archaeon AArc-xg1-1]MCU4975155.1 hypothetical protein [Halobacteria archaeon AArc-m2/3/4]